MKQRVTIEDWLTLMKENPEGSKRLREMWKPKLGDVYYEISGEVGFGESVISNPIQTKSGWYMNPSEETIQEKFVTIDKVPLLSIGQMIEFITSNYPDDEEWQIDRQPMATDQKLAWAISTYIHFPLDEEMDTLAIGHTELCDCLWSAVKYILSKHDDR